MAVRGSTGKRLVARSIPDWRSYWYSAFYSVLVSQTGCNERKMSPSFFFFFLMSLLSSHWACACCWRVINTAALPCQAFLFAKAGNEGFSSISALKPQSKGKYPDDPVSEHDHRSAFLHLLQRLLLDAIIDGPKSNQRYCPRGKHSQLRSVPGQLQLHRRCS